MFQFILFYMVSDEWKLILPLFKKLQESPSFYMKQVMQKYEKNLSDILVDFELTPTQMELLTGLAVLMKEGTPINQNDVAIFVNRDKNTVSEVLRTLEKKGYIARFKSSSDKRAKSLVITDNGLSIIENAINDVLVLDDQFFPKGSDRDELIKLLIKYL